MKTYLLSLSKLLLQRTLNFLVALSNNDVKSFKINHFNLLRTNNFAHWTVQIFVTRKFIQQKKSSVYRIDIKPRLFNI